MKELLMISGGIFLTLIVLAALSILALVISLSVFMPKFLKTIPQTVELNEEAQDFVNTAILEIVTDWNFTKLFEKATPQLLELTHAENSERIFEFCRRLGKLESYHGATGGWQTSTDEVHEVIGNRDVKLEKLSVGNYMAEANFEKGLAHIRVQIVRRDNQWFINSFTIGTQGVTTTLGIPTTLEALVDTDRKKIRLEALLKTDERKE